MGRECDNCRDATYTADNPRVFVCTPRPSDPAEMCCVMAGHKTCMIQDQEPKPSEHGGAATAEQWEEWIESPEALKAGFLWLTL